MKIIKRIALLGVSGLLVLAAAVSLGKPAVAEDCVQSDPSVTVEALRPVGAPGTTVTYTIVATNNDSVGCANSNLGFEVTQKPFDWSAIVEPLLVLDVAPGATVNASVAVTSSPSATAGDYGLKLTTSQYTDTVVRSVETAFTYTVLTVVEDDYKAPQVTITSPGDGSTVKKNSTVFIMASAIDNVGITSLAYRVDGVTLCSGPGTTVCEWQTPHKRGTHTITVVARDAAGNIGMDLHTVDVR